MKVLHITGWYPNDSNIHEAAWVQRHIEAVSPYVSDYFVLHLEVKPSNRFHFSRTALPKGIQRRLELPLNSWMFAELLTGALLVFYLVKLRSRTFDVINIHIAYPLLVYWHILKRFFKTPVVITEHWSAYHFNFGVSKTGALHRIRRIFRQQIPVIAVSRALAADIRRFSNCDYPFHIVPNVVDHHIFYPDRSSVRQNFFFMVSQWKWPKRPLVVFEAFKMFAEVHPDFRLLVGGYGADFTTLKDWITQNRLDEKVLLLGPLTSGQIADFFRSCAAFLHCSEYETFSVVCAEAVCCKAPVLASNVGGIREVVREGDGLLIDRFDSLSWMEGMKAVLNGRFSSKSRESYLKANVGRLYYDTLMSVIRKEAGRENEAMTPGGAFPEADIAETQDVTR